MRRCGLQYLMSWRFSCALLRDVRGGSCARDTGLSEAPTTRGALGKVFHRTEGHIQIKETTTEVQPKETRPFRREQEAVSWLGPGCVRGSAAGALLEQSCARDYELSSRKTRGVLHAECALLLLCAWRLVLAGSGGLCDDHGDDDAYQ